MPYGKGEDNEWSLFLLTEKKKDLAGQLATPEILTPPCNPLMHTNGV
jgi:hypothetical protein